MNELVTVLASDWKMPNNTTHVKIVEGWMGRFELDLTNPNQTDWTRLVCDVTLSDGKKVKLIGKIQWESIE